MVYAYERTLAHFGEARQIKKLHEECLELLEVLYAGDIEGVIDEAGDVFNIIMQLDSAFDGDIKAGADKKMKRTLDRISNGYYDED